MEAALAASSMLLPHGYEGQGPEHSSARIERFLQLAAEDSIQVAYAIDRRAATSTCCAGRRCGTSRKPLIVFTPKSLLRQPAAASTVDALGRESFLTVMPEREVTDPETILLCTGKLVHELRAERDKRGADKTAIVALEQLYPFPRHELAAELDRFRDARNIVWIQEEPANMGALFFVVPRIEALTRGRHVRTLKRSASASPATGSPKAHKMEQTALIELAFSKRAAAQTG